MAAARLAEDGLAVTARLGDARELPVADDAFDAALLLGPLYHLTEREDRLTALREARRAVRPGGLAFVAAINRFASLFDGLAQGFLLEPGFREIVETDLRTGWHHNPGNHPSWFTTAYFHHPDELRAECHDAGLDVVELVGVEGMAGRLYPLTERWDDTAARAIESEPSLLGLSPHPLLTARVPA